MTVPRRVLITGLGVFLLTVVVRSRRGAKFRYRDTTRRGSFLHRIGGSSRTKFSFRSKQDVSALAAISPMRVSMTSDGFTDEVSLVPILTARGATFKIARDAYAE